MRTRKAPDEFQTLTRSPAIRAWEAWMVADPDAGAVLSYALTDDAGGRFAIDATTGQITVASGALLNFEAAASHDVTVRVTPFTCGRKLSVTITRRIGTHNRPRCTRAR